MPKDNEVDEKVVARYVWTNAGMKGGEPQWAGNWVRYDDHAATVAELRAEVADLKARLVKQRRELGAETLCGLKDLMMRQVKWKPCDCGCPQQRTPDGPHSVTWLRAAQQVEIAISKSKAEDRE